MITAPVYSGSIKSNRPTFLQILVLFVVKFFFNIIFFSTNKCLTPAAHRPPAEQATSRPHGQHRALRPQLARPRPQLRARRAQQRLRPPNHSRPVRPGARRPHGREVEVRRALPALHRPLLRHGHVLLLCQVLVQDVHAADRVRAAPDSGNATHHRHLHGHLQQWLGE